EDQQGGSQEYASDEGYQGAQDEEGGQEAGEGQGAQEGGYTQATLGDLGFDGSAGTGPSADNPDVEDANADIYGDDNSGGNAYSGDGDASNTSDNPGNSGYSNPAPARGIATAPLMENLGTAGPDALRGDDLSTSSEQFEMSTEDVWGEGTFTEEAAGESGYQMAGSMHAHESGGEGSSGEEGNSSSREAGSTATAEQEGSDIPRIDYDLQTGGLISSGRAGWATSSELSEANGGGGAGETGGAGEAGAPEFGSGGGTDASDSEPDFTMGEPTIPFRNDNPGSNLEVDNEPPHPGDTSTTDRDRS
ncbi:MAG TPA: hypothetical protein VF914_04080, partial [Chloroflexia bacterium]